MSDWPHSLKVGPIGDWPGALTSQRQVSKFSASLTHTLRTLDREIWNLVDTKAQQDSAELLIAIPAGAFRREPLASTALTQEERADVRAWAAREGVAIPKRGPLPKSVIEAYRAARGASSEAQADDAPKSERSKPAPPRKLKPMTPAEQPPALSEPAEHELAGVLRHLAEHPEDASPVVVDLNTGVVEAVDSDGLTLSERWKRDAIAEIDVVQLRYDVALSRATQAEAALELALRKWDEERTRRRGQSVLLRSMARQVVLAEQERRDDAETLAGMDRALEAAYERIYELQEELAKAHAAAAAPWWKRGAA